MTTTSDDVATRSWWLRAWATTEGKPLVYDGTCAGDHDLSVALASVERRPDFGRVVVKLGRSPHGPTYRAPLRDPREPAAEAGPAEPVCSECDMPESECRRRESVSGHRFAPPKKAARR